MPTQITITGLSGSSPFDIYTCDTGYTTCIYIATITSGQIPYVFNLPYVLEGMGSVGVNSVDSNNCLVEENLII